MRRLPPLTAIEAFVEVARLGSAKAAAAALALSPPALSRRLATLERFVGRPLFERRHQLLLITAEGERLMASIGPAIDALARAMEPPGGGGERLRLKLGVHPLFASQRLIPRLSDLRAMHGDLHVDIDTGPDKLARLTDGLDAAIMLGVDFDPSLYARRIDTNIIVAVGAKADAARLRRPAELRGETVLLHRDMPATFDVYRTTVGLPALEPRSVQFLDSGQLMLDTAAQGLGVAFMLGCHLDPADDRLAPLFGVTVPSPYNYWFVARRPAMARAPVRLFHDWLFAALGEAEPEPKRLP